MRKLLILVLLLSIIFPIQATPGNGNDPLLCSDTLRVQVDQLAVNPDLRYIENNAFGVGEKLTFTIGWKMVKAGEAVMEVNDVFDREGRPVYKIRTLARSFPFFDGFFKVRDTAESWIDVEGLFTWHFRKSLHEGSFDSQIKQEYDQTRGIVYSKDTIFTVPQYVQDVLSALYYIRTLDLNVGDTVLLNNFSKIKCYPLKVIIQKKEIIEVPAGKFKCVKVEPLLQAAGIFKQEGTLAVWLTDDRLKMPVLMKSKVLVGSIYAELTDYQIGELYEWE